MANDPLGVSDDLAPIKGLKVIVTTTKVVARGAVRCGTSTRESTEAFLC